ncbi:serine/threonine-protein kinase SBK1-like [Caloenas nicobarica]|uniref:serine/threonine-protein kinase SBK1-like n=1 Tax=Caloenas nicobarica TaxID=187106 RepID=UPI0032B756E8
MGDVEGDEDAAKAALLEEDEDGDDDEDDGDRGDGADDADGDGGADDADGDGGDGDADDDGDGDDADDDGDGDDADDDGDGGDDDDDGDGDDADANAALLERLMARTGRALPRRELEDDWDVLGELGRGSYGHVVLAEPRGGGPAVVLKVLPKARTGRRAFLRELSIARRVSGHPGCLRALPPAFEAARLFAFALELAPAGDLCGLLTPGEGLPERLVKRVAAQLAGALDFVHGRALVHRDVKLDNVLLWDRECRRVKLGDFGLARPRGCPVGPAAAGGALPHAPPELRRLRGRQRLRLEPSVDVWALGVLIFCLATGCFPWAAAAHSDPQFREFAAWAGGRGGRAGPPSAWSGFAPPGLRLLRRLLRLEPERRHPARDVTAFLALPWVAAAAPGDKGDAGDTGDMGTLGDARKLPPAATWRAAANGSAGRRPHVGRAAADWSAAKRGGGARPARPRPLPPNAGRAGTRRLVALIDSDGGGAVGRAELRDWLERRLRGARDESVARAWGRHDRDGDGAVTWSEYRGGTFGDPGDFGDTGRPELYRRLLARERRRFGAADGDGDGRVTRQEFAAFLHPEDFERMRDIVVTETMEDMDKDGDGFVQEDEYIGEPGRRGPSRGVGDTPDAWVPFWGDGDTPDAWVPFLGDTPDAGVPLGGWGTPRMPGSPFGGVWGESPGRLGPLLGG